MENSHYEGTEFQYGYEYDIVVIEPTTCLLYVRREIEALGVDLIEQKFKT